MSMANRVSFVPYECYEGRGYTHQLCNGGAVFVAEYIDEIMVGAGQGRVGQRDVSSGYCCPSGRVYLTYVGYDVRDHITDFESEEDMERWIIARTSVVNAPPTWEVWSGVIGYPDLFFYGKVY